MRIIGGKLKGHKLRSVRGTKTRPTADRTREAIFNIIAFQVPGATVLDLFAGTGALGIEALSRGAQSAVFIDISNQSISVLRGNLASLPLESPTKVIQWDLSRNLNCLHSSALVIDLVFMDPPYNENLITPTLGHLHTSQCLANNAHIIVEHSHLDPVFPDQLPFKIVDQRQYGKTLVAFLNYVL
ncbi:MAG: 16S rRNA (guanine(966)-N(2))-methyltransferase RsmD [Desulfobacterales bacterium]